MKFVKAVLIAAIAWLALLPAGSHATSRREAAPDRSPALQPNAGDSAPLIFWNRQITVFRSYYDRLSPAERAARAAERLAALPQTGSDGIVVANQISIGQYSGVVITVNGLFVFAILTGDLDPESEETLTSAADRAIAQLRAAFDARSRQRRWPVLLRGLALSLGATLLLALGFWLVMRFNRRMLGRLGVTAQVQSRHFRLGGLDLWRLINTLNRGLAKLTAWAAAAVLIYLWLTFILLRFPYSQPWGQRLGSFLIDLFGMLGTGFLHSVPGLFTTVVIFLLTRSVVRMTSVVFGEVESGRLELPWLHQDTVRATRSMVVTLIWIFAITVAYPYIPGSSTDAFKGISVLVGLMISLGSAGLINQVTSGLVIVYSRALRAGEFVRIGDDLGTVREVGMLSTKILTLKREEITIPNTVLVGTKTVNYSRHAAGAGAVVGTTVTIGYDAPWRQVHALLLQAAGQTAGVRKEPAPRVWQRSLSDFYVEYELIISLDYPEERVPILSELHMHIQDAFNERGVQIMSPHFEAQPHQKVWVPKSQWFGEPPEISANQNSAAPSSALSPDRQEG